jgi:hypothetical protein
MANALYGKGRDKFLNGDIDWTADTIKALLVDTANYTVSIDTHEFLSDIAAGARIGTATALASKSSALGVADANDTTFSSVSGATVEAIVLYRDSGTEGTSALIAYIDTATGLPFTPNGGDVTVAWDNGANKIFKL